MTNTIINEYTSEIYQHFKKKGFKIYDEEKHCKLIIKIMIDPDKGCYTNFCIDSMISESTFWHWVKTHELFSDLYYFCRMIAKQIWFQDGRRIRDKDYPLGSVNYEFEHWKLMGWTRFGISKNSKIKININPEDSPAEHYKAIMKQASEGDFTASEFKQMMEAVNVGLNVQQVYELQNQINELKSDLTIMTANAGVENPFSNKGTPQKD